MPKKISEVDSYIAKSSPFAQPILKKIRTLFHKADPGIEETIKWGIPYFVHDGMVGGMAAFKKHVGLTFWKGKLMGDPQGLFDEVGKTRMFSLRIESLSDLPVDRVLLSYIKEAVELNKKGIKSPYSSKRKSKSELEVPGYFMDRIEKNKQALATFENFSYTNRKEYVEWVTEAKQEATREKRIATAVEWMAEGKPRNWKYIKQRP